MSLKLERLDKVISNILKLQECYFKMGKHAESIKLGNRINDLMDERKEIIADLFAEEDTCVDWYYAKEEVDEEAILDEDDEAILDEDDEDEDESEEEEAVLI